MIRWWLFEKPLLTLRTYGRKRFRSKELLMSAISNFDVSLLLDWLMVVDDTFKKRWWDLDDFDANNNDIWFFCVKLGNIDVSLLLPWWFVDDASEGHCWNIENCQWNFCDFFVFVVLTSRSLICHCWSIGESLLIHWRNIDDITEFWMQTIKIIEVSNVLIIRTLMLFAAWLIFRWWSYEESSIRFGDLDANINDNTLFVLISDILMFHYCFLDDSLMMLWGDIIETLISSKEAFFVYFVFVVLPSESLMFQCFFIDDSLMTLGRINEVTAKI